MPPSKSTSDFETVVIIADIEESSAFAERNTLATYNRIIRQYHRIAAKAIDQYLQHSEIPNTHTFRRAYGDEVLVILKTEHIPDAVRHALHLAVLLDVKWMRSNFNSQRLKDKLGICRIRIGIGCGRLRWQESVWNQGKTPEGYLIVLTKHIESNAAERIKKPDTPRILVDFDLRQKMDHIEGVDLGETFTLIDDKDKKIRDVEVFNILKHDKLYAEYSKRINAKKRVEDWFAKGYTAIIAGKYEEALTILEELQKIQPYNKEILDAIDDANDKISQRDKGQNSRNR